MIHGEGLWTWPDGSSYAGEAKHGLREGKGLYSSEMRVSSVPSARSDVNQHLPVYTLLAIFLDIRRVGGTILSVCFARPSCLFLRELLDNRLYLLKSFHSASYQKA